MPGKDGRRGDPSKLAVTVDRLPDGIVGPAYARVAFLVDASGAVQHCTSVPGERRRFLQTVDALGPQACDALARGYRPTLARDAAGVAVTSVQTVMVRFETPAAP